MERGLCIMEAVMWLMMETGVYRMDCVICLICMLERGACVMEGGACMMEEVHA